jgi:hypothetical protein
MEKSDALTRSVNPNEVAALALQAIDSVTNLSNQYMTYTSIILAIFALIGFSVLFGAVRWYARSAGTKCANDHMQKYINNGEARLLLELLIEEAVEKQLKRRTINNIHPERSATQEGPRFTRDPRSSRRP